MAGDAPILAVTGLLAEARIAAGPGIVTVAGGGEARRLASMIEAVLVKGVRAVMSFGIAGGLAPTLAPGVAVVARRVDDGERRYECDPHWAERLLAAMPEAISADLAGVEAAVRDKATKAALREATGAAAVDMESHIAARLAARHGVPFAALRVLADPAGRNLPRAALAGMRPDGSTDVGAVLRTLGRHPSDLPALIRTALDAGAAFSGLARHRRRLGPHLGFEAGAFTPPKGSGVELPAESA